MEDMVQQLIPVLNMLAEKYYKILDSDDWVNSEKFE